MPRCVTLDNEKATLQVARAQPIFKAQASTQNTTGGSEVTYTNLGTILEVTPRITADDRVWMKIVPEVSSVFATIRKTVANTINEADVYDVRRIETQVIIPHAHTLVLGGLMNDNSANGYTKVPLLGDIPVLGYAFRHDSKTRDKRNLLIFITPTIIRDSDYQDADTGAKYMQSRPMTIAGGLDPSSAWQSGRPKNWDNPGQISAEDAVFDDSLLAPKQPATANP